MAKIRVKGDTSGYIDIAAPDIAGAATVNLDKIPQTDQVATFNNTLNVTQSGQTGIAFLKNTNASWAGDFNVSYDPGNTGTAVSNVGLSARSNGDVWIISSSATGSMRIITGGANDKMVIDASGNVTMPSQPSFMAIGQATTLPTSTDTLLRFNTTTFNTGGHYNTSTYRFTAPVTGVYYFHVQVRLTGVSNNGRYDIIFRKNGTGAMGGGQNQQGSNDPGINVSAFLSLAANDYVDVYMNQNNGSSLTTDTSLNTSQGGTSAATHFFGYLVK